jgi:cystathionine gamma-lyase
MHLSTRSIHVGNEKDPLTGAVIPPLYLSSTYAPEGDFSTAVYDYARSGNPTRAGLETTLAALEEGVGALAFSSGMAAIHAATQLLRCGDHIIAGTDIYGGTYRLLHKILNRSGIETSLVPLDDLEAVRSAIRTNTRMIWVENPGNPLLTLVDIEALAAIAHEHNALLAVDNTFATPVATQPLTLGADIVMHSATKFLGGHSDLLGGALVVKDATLLKELYFIQNAIGAVMSPFDCFLCSRGIKTLEVRFREQCKSALWIAQYLAHHPAVRRVHYPGLPDHPHYELAQRQLRGFYGAVVSFELDADYAATQRFVEATRLFQRAVSVGAVESLIEQPASMSHASYDKADRLKAGIDDGLIRLSVGLEHVHDLLNDLQHAFRIAVPLEDAPQETSVLRERQVGFLT